MKNLVKILTVLCCICLLIVACDGMNDIQQKYLDESQQVYLGKVDSILSFSGLEKVKLVWYINADPKIETTVIYWNFRQDSLVKPFERIQEGHHGIQKDSVIIENLPEGTYNFELVNKNRYGESSLKSEVRGVSYGDEYRSTLATRPISSVLISDVSAQSSTVRINWGGAPARALGTRVSYKKRSTGEEVIEDVINTVGATTLTDVGNRLGNPDDFVKISSVYALPVGECESPVQNRQDLYFVSSGTRIENTVYEGTPATHTYTYANQDKLLSMMNPEGNLVFNCNRVAELIPAARGTTFSITINNDRTVDVSGAYSIPGFPIFNTESVNSTYNTETGAFTLRYTVISSGGSYTVEETLVPKTTPLEMQVPKPFGDMRAIIPGDNNTTFSDIYYPIERAWDGFTGQNGWLGAAPSPSPSITFDLKRKMKLTRMIIWSFLDGPASIYTFYNVLKFEIWGIAELDESKLSNPSYWADAQGDYTGTFKADWVFLGYYEVERLDHKGAPNQVIINRGQEGNHFIIPESAGPVRYIRFYSRESAPPTLSYSPNCYAIGEFSFFGHEQ